MILQVLADAGQGVNQRNIELAQQFRAADAGALQDLRRAMAPAHSSTSLLAVAFDGAVLSPSSHSTPTARLPAKII
jgi:hypothetical protein